MRRRGSTAELTVDNDLQDYGLRCRGYPNFSLRALSLFRRTTRINDGLKKFKKQADLAVSIFLFRIGCVVVVAAGKLAWTWWTSLWMRGRRARLRTARRLDVLPM
jgi:hypothetical protein